MPSALEVVYGLAKVISSSPFTLYDWSRKEHATQSEPMRVTMKTLNFEGEKLSSFSRLEQKYARLIAATAKKLQAGAPLSMGPTQKQMEQTKEKERMSW